MNSHLFIKFINLIMPKVPPPISENGNVLFKNTIKAGGSTATKMWTG